VSGGWITSSTHAVLVLAGGEAEVVIARLAAGGEQRSCSEELSELSLVDEPGGRHRVGGEAPRRGGRSQDVNEVQMAKPGNPIRPEADLVSRHVGSSQTLYSVPFRR